MALLMRAGFFLFLGLFALGIAGGCGGKTRSRELPSFAVENMQRGAPAYTNDIPRSSMSGSDPHLARKFLGGLGKDERIRFRHDPRLDAVATAYAHAFASEESRPARGLVRWMMWNQGIGATLEDVDSMWAGGRSVHHRLDVDLRRYAFKFEAEDGRYTFGAARVRTGPNRWGQSIVVAHEPIILSDIRKEYQPREELLIRGRIVDEYERAYVTVDLGDLGDVSLLLNPDENGKFIAKFPAPSTPGGYRIEIDLYRGPGRWERAFFAPIYVGQPEPAQPDPEVLRPVPNPSDMKTWPEFLLARYNEARARLGLAPLKLSTKASELAREHAREYGKAAYTPMPHFSEQLKEQGIPLGESSWSRRRFENLNEQARENMQSPWMRSDILDDEMTHIGLAFERVDSDRWSLYSMVQIVFEEEDSSPTNVKGFLERVKNRDRNRDEETEALARKLSKKMSQLAKVEVEHEPRLDALAWYNLQNSGIESHLKNPMRWKTGVWGSTFMWSRRRVEKNSVDPYWVRDFAGRVARKEENRTARYKLGFARRQAPDGREIQSLFIVKREVELESFDRIHTPGEDIVLEGRFLGEPHYPHVFIDLGGTEVFEHALKVDRAGRFKVRLPLARNPGRYFVQLKTYPIGYDPDELEIYYRGHSVLLWPLHVGEQPAEGIDARFLTPLENPKDRGTWSAKVLEHYNRERKSQGLEPLVSNELAAVVIESKLERDDKDMDSPSFLKVDDRLKTNAIGSVVTANYRYGKYITATVAWNLMRPTFKKMLFDPKTAMAAVVFEDEGNWYSEMLLRRRSTSRSDIESKYALSVDTAQSSWSAAKLSGEDSRKLDENLDGALDDAKKCYEEELKYYRELEGTVSVRYVIGIDGKVIAALLDEASPRNTDLENCIVDVVDGLQFPHSFTGRVTPAEVTFELEPKAEFEAGRKSIVGEVSIR